MGLDTTHNCWHGPYSSFNTWRRAVCAAAGVSFDRDDYTDENLLGVWKDEPKDILDVLIEHQDCEGIIASRHCGPLADRLEGLIDNMPATDHPHGPRQETRRFIEGLRLAASMGDNVEFN